VLELQGEGIFSVRREIMVSAGSPLILQIELKKVPTTGRVKINAQPERAAIRVDGKLVGETSAEVELPIGGHQYEVQLPKFLPQREEFTISGGQERTIVVTLKPVPKSLAERWYVWVPIGGAIAVGLGVGLGIGLKPPTCLVGTLGCSAI
jgi:hypothetical protein